MILTKDTPHADLHELMLIHTLDGEPTWAQVEAFRRHLLGTKWAGKPLSEIPTYNIVHAIVGVLLAEACQVERRVDADGLFIAADGPGHPEYDAESQFERFTPNV